MTAYPNGRDEGSDTPSRAGDPLVETARPLIACSRDPLLARALQELAATEAVAITLVEDLHSLTDELMRQPRAVALLDAAALDAPVEGAVDAVMELLPDLRLLVAGQGAEQSLLATRIATQKVFRFVHKPASPQRIKLFLEAALTQAAPRAPEALTAPPAALRAVQTPRKERGSPPVAVMIAGLLLLVGSAGAWIWNSRDESPRAGRAAAPPGSATAAAIAPLLQRAEAAFAAGRPVAADGSGAAQLYREALRLAPGNVEAESGFMRSIDRALQMAEEALLAGRVDDAATQAEAVALVAPENSRMAFLNAQIERELARIHTDESQRLALEARQVRVDAALALMNESLARGALLEPEDNSALSRFREAEAAGASLAAVRSAREALVGALLTAADTALVARQPAAARRLVDAASSINSSAPGLDVMRRRAVEGAVQLAAATLAPAASSGSLVSPPAPTAPLPLPALAEPAPQTAASPVPATIVLATISEPPADTAATTAQPSVISAGALRVLHQEPVVYPQRALNQLISGWVELEFTVTQRGNVEDVLVTASEPGRTFDAAAIAALRGYRYAPVLRDGSPVSQRARIRLRFAAQDGR